MDWLEESGIERSRLSLSTGKQCICGKFRTFANGGPGHNWVQFDGTVEEAERLFATEYWHYQHAESGGYRLACDEYSLPEHVQPHVDFAMPTIQLEGLKPVANVITSRDLMVEFTEGAIIGSQPCGSLITIDCLRELYQFPASNLSAAGNEMGIGEWADYLYEADLPIFFKNFTSPQIPANTRPDFISIDGGLTANLTTVSQESGVESALDFQSAYAIIYPQKLRLYQVGDGINMDSVGTFNIWLDALDESYCTYEGGDQPYIGEFEPISQHYDGIRVLTAGRSCIPGPQRQ